MTGAFCHSPFNSLAFLEGGYVATCTNTRSGFLGRYPESSVSELWLAPGVTKLRRNLTDLRIPASCLSCKTAHRAGSLEELHARQYDLDSQGGHAIRGGGPPTRFDFEFSGSKESTRRYNAAFVDEVFTLSESLEIARFGGPEPLTNPVYFRLWNGLRRANPRVELEIATPGTAFDLGISRMLCKHRPRVVLRVDALDRVTYDKLMPNGDFDRMGSHLNSFFDLARRRWVPTTVRARVTPLNWRSIPDLVDLCNECEIPFSGRLTGWHESLEKAEEAADFLADGIRPARTPVAASNRLEVERVIGQLKARRETILWN